MRPRIETPAQYAQHGGKRRACFRGVVTVDEMTHIGCQHEHSDSDEARNCALERAKDLFHDLGEMLHREQQQMVKRGTVSLF